MLTLYDYFRSGTSHRTRIALHLKGAPFTRIGVDLIADAHKSDAYRALNPQGLAPTLILPDGARLTQSTAIIEWLDEAYPSPPFLPRDPITRARVRAIASIVACDIHPLGNKRVLQWLREEAGQDPKAVAGFAARWTQEGFAAIEALLNEGPGGPWCWGEAPGLADIYVVSQAYAATSRYGVDLSAYPRIAAAVAAADAHPAFQAAHPSAQPEAAAA